MLELGGPSGTRQVGKAVGEGWLGDLRGGRGARKRRLARHEDAERAGDKLESGPAHQAVAPEGKVEKRRGRACRGRREPDRREEHTAGGKAATGAANQAASCAAYPSSGRARRVRRCGGGGRQRSTDEERRATTREEDSARKLPGACPREARGETGATCGGAREFGRRRKRGGGIRTGGEVAQGRKDQVTLETGATGEDPVALRDEWLPDRSVENSWLFID